MEQDTLIFIDDKEKLDASAAANAFTHKDTKNRAYINTLGAELAMKYLLSEDIQVANTCNIHSIKKILEEIDISDIMLDNIHIDVRVVFDENAIFIPKSHFEYNLVPDIYLVFNLAKDHSHVKFLGFFEPKLINENSANKDYYFIEKEKLTLPSNLKTFIKNFKGNTSKNLSSEEIEHSERIIISMTDNDVSENDKKYLIKQLTKSAFLRDRFIEYENFETLSYKAMTDSQISKKEIQPNIVSGIVPSDKLSGNDEISDEFNEITDDINTLADNLLETDTPIDGIVGGVIGGVLGEAIDEALELPTEELSEVADEVLPETSDLISLDNLEEINPELDNSDIETETISLDDIEPVEQTVEEEELDIDTISLDEVNAFDTVETDTEEETISLDNIEPLELETEDIPESSDDVALDNIESTEDVIAASNEESPMSIEELPETNLEDIQDTIDDINDITDINAIPDIADINTETEEIAQATDDYDINSLENDISDNIDEIDINNLETIEEFTSNIDELNSLSSIEETQEETSSIDSVSDDIDFLNNIDITENTNVSEAVSLNDYESKELDTDITAENNSEGFGKNLIENLSNEDVIKIEDITDPETVKASELTNTIEQLEEVIEQENNEYADEIQLDNNDSQTLEDDEDLNILYNEETPDVEFTPPETEENIPVAEENLPQKSNTKTILAAGLLLVALAGVSAYYMFNKPKGEIEEPVALNNPIESEKPLETNTPDIAQTSNPQINIEQTTQELKSTAVAAKPISSGSYVTVNKLVWDVPSELTYSNGIQDYLKKAGKSIKLTLSTDLLLVNEYAYTNNVKVGLKLSNNGSIQEARILASSGSDQIDKVVLQSVKDTLSVLKPPSGEINTPNFNLNLIIYF